MHAIIGCLTIMIGISVQSVPVPEASNLWTERLERLDPSRPIEYFELGEEIADIAEEHSDEQRLALELFALAGQLDFKRLGRSSILAIGEFTSNPLQKRRLLDAADLLSTQRLFQPSGVTDQGGVLQAQIDFGMMLAALRLERWDEAIDLLENPQVRTLLFEYGDLLGVDPKIVLLELESGRVSVIGDMKRHLIAEWSVLARSELDWAVELEVSSGVPLTVIDLGDMQNLLGADVRRPYWRSGSWSDSSVLTAE